MRDLERDHPDPHAEGLPPLLVDRQRVVHAAAFRRLQQKTQVFVAPESDHFRTRLTHTLEVAHLARTLATLLGWNADLAEVVALAHDLGHPPFGHAGEKALDACMRGHGGFEHNRHTLRVAEVLEHPYPEFRGLNLTRAVRECLAKHRTPYDRPRPHPLQDGRTPPPECALVDFADRAAYAMHDILDGLHAGLLSPEELAGVRLWQAAYEGPASDDPSWRGHLRPAADRMQRALLEDLCADASRTSGGALHLSAAMEERLTELDAFLRAHLYRSRDLVRADEQACRILSDVFEALVARPEHLPERFRRRLDADGIHQVVADYVAGMTDRYCLEVHVRLADA